MNKSDTESGLNGAYWNVDDRVFFNEHKELISMYLLAYSNQSTNHQ